jgi:cellulose synthase/poly-beta-1,6-N-acetylglucosamine synthase-like glycosyltransferase
VIAVLWLSVYGFNAIVLAVLYLRHRREEPVLGQFDEWPIVTVQIPTFNERYVIERVIDAVAALDYPRDRLQVQVLDDSTDDTTTLACGRVNFHHQRGLDITLIHRENRQGYKAGALRGGLELARGEFIAVFDADFVPQPDFLKRMLLAFAGQPDVGFVQARWTYHNTEESVLTRALALAGDAHFIVEQVGRNRSGLLINFNGSGGIWRRACIDGVGGWQGDTLTEDMDLCYRAQMAGWRAVMLPHVTVAAELPAQVALFKQQQFRWAKGSAQTLRKLFWPLLRSRLSLAQKAGALIHITTYFSQVLMLILLISWLPMIVYSTILHELPLAFFGVSTVGLPLICAITQIELHRDWLRRLLYLPVLLSLGCGLALSNAWAVLEGLMGVHSEFVRTPKVKTTRHLPAVEPVTYWAKLDGTVVGELGLTVFVLFLMNKVIIYVGYGAIPFLMLYAFGFGYVAGDSLLILPRRALAMLRASTDTRLN